MKKPFARFRGKGGYPAELKDALELFTRGVKYRIDDARVSGFDTRLMIGDRWFNSVMFGISVERVVKHFPNSFQMLRRIGERGTL